MTLNAGDTWNAGTGSTVMEENSIQDNIPVDNIQRMLSSVLNPGDFDARGGGGGGGGGGGVGEQGSLVSLAPTVHCSASFSLKRFSKRVNKQTDVKMDLLGLDGGKALLFPYYSHTKPYYSLLFPTNLLLLPTNLLLIPTIPY